MGTRYKGDCNSCKRREVCDSIVYIKRLPAANNSGEKINVCRHWR